MDLSLTYTNLETVQLPIHPNYLNDLSLKRDTFSLKLPPESDNSTSDTTERGEEINILHKSFIQTISRTQKAAQDCSGNNTLGDSESEESVPEQGNSSNSVQLKINYNDLQCHCCRKTFLSRNTLRKHIKVHTTTTRPYSCDICGKSYKRTYDLQIHKIIHKNKTKLSCDQCNFSTFYYATLSNHCRKHTQNFKYNCQICGKGFYIKTWWKEHIKYFHSGNKPFKCEICHVAFVYSRYLTTHKKEVHSNSTGLKPNNQCPFCDRLFAQLKSLKHHMKSHSGEKNKFTCDVCHMELSSQNNLKTHKLIHTGEKSNMCSICGKTFAKKFNLISHERTHTGEKPYSCDQCNKGFSQQSALVIHRRQHSGEHPYKCSLCQKGFVCQSNLTAHLKVNCSKQLNK